MASEVLLPKQGNSVESCIIVAWKVAEGAQVARGDVLMEVETDKATMDVESTADGVLLAQLVSEGDDVPVLSPIALVGEAGEQVETRQLPPASAKSADPEETGSSDPAVSAPQESGTTPEPARRRRGGAKISPRARKLAATKGIDYEQLSGSGPGGRIMVRDLEAAMSSGAAARASRPQAAPQGPAGPAQPVSQTETKGVRKLIAERMHASLASTAQLTMDSSADARAILAYRAQLKGAGELAPHEGSLLLKDVSINDLVLFAVSRVLRDFPGVNATYRDGVISTYDQVDLGFAVDTPKGLMVPVIRDAGSKSLVELASEAHRLAAGCLEGRINPDELSGGTFTVTNLGAFGVERFTPVLNAPQVAILGVCAVTRRPSPDGTTTVPMMGLSLTIDHQVVDGAPAARFLQALARAIAGFELTLAY